MADQSAYAAAASIPLIKSPSLRVPQKVELPPDIHPLPDSVTPYFVYPFTLEPHVLTLESSRRSTIAAHAARREEYLRQRETEKERRRKEALRRIAPGFEPQGVLVPESRHAAHKPSNSLDGSMLRAESYSPPGHQRSRSVMDDLVESLAALDAAKSPPPPPQPLSPTAFPPPPPPVNQRLS
ncbi:hypothetical protein D9611_014364 [Ephemerocybe angulata]|uniref:Uncharacterized protein n=1 Tax=Ephemerocybe angulata TaxID=980116 RepID=A0A8H5B845_9AGAR|nr:hypothetical protein D9611_014364 [Tulosesus angulatus]